MSTAIDSRRRPSLWSYISFGSTPRRRSISLPTRNTNFDPYEKVDRHSNGYMNGSSSPVDKFKNVWMTQSPRARVVKTAGVVVFLVFLFFLLVRSERSSVGHYVGSHTGSSYSSNPPNGATKCSKPYSSEKPLIQYALMIDAGSTGSRIHVYRFNNCGPTPELEHEEFKQTAKKEGGSSGLSAYGGDPEGAAKSLDILMDVALKTVPVELQSCSPVAVKATAGLRKLGSEKSDAILAAVRTRLETVYPFPVVSKENGGVIVMDGRDEGVYAWITINYLLGKLGGPEKTPTAAVFDLGGGSTQIVFEPTFKSPSKGMPAKLEEGDHKYKLTFGGRDIELYQHSHLGYGLMAAREAMHKALILAKKAAHGLDTTWTSKPIENPCIAPNMTREVKIELDGITTPFTMTGPSTGSPAECRGLAEKILQKDAECKLAPCSFGGVHQPSLSQTFAREDLYIISYFYDRTQIIGMPESFTIKELMDLTAKVCDGERSWGTFEGVEGALEDLRGRPEHCLDLSFMVALLHTGYEMPSEREVRIAKQIKGNELGWCLGASLPLLEANSGWQCRIKEVS